MLADIAADAVQLIALELALRKSSSALRAAYVRAAADAANGIKVDETVQTRTISWRQDGKLHRADGPAVITEDITYGTHTLEAWCRNGVLDRLVKRDAATGKVTRDMRFVNGRVVESPPSAWQNYRP